MKLWNKAGIDDDPRIDAFTVGKDRELDLMLAPYDILGSMAHVTMLGEVGLMEKDEVAEVLPALSAMYADAAAGKFRIDPDVEDVHSQVEMNLTRDLGPVGKKIHTGRSRNDQVLVDIKLMCRDRIHRTVLKVNDLCNILLASGEKWKDLLVPGYTHMQVAMPSSFGLWFGAYAESLADDLLVMRSAYDVSNLNPLGSAAGYGSSAPIDRRLTTRLLGFADLDWNVVNAQLWRGKTERVVAFAYSSVAETLGRFAMDVCLGCCQNFGFLSLPPEMTTGSSIMPHKKNPDVFELVRAHCNRICGVASDIRLITGNLPSGYSRDLQLVKEVFFPMFEEMDSVLDIVAFAVKGMKPAAGIMDDSRYKYAFSVEKVNSMLKDGVPFRDAYRAVGEEIARGEFDWKPGSTASSLGHTHEGSLGNLCYDSIREKLSRSVEAFGFGKIDEAIEALVR